jgi:MFS superfamily sulfate permease-like transporter
VAQSQGDSMKLITLAIMSVMMFILWAAIYLGIIAAIVWVVVKVLKATGVLH